ncbi:MAG: YdcF family protein, partial [Candidatus Berkelbacteria bacterium]|nr:YdcF family protein [Candidatus Berkelbacteria bacterium]
YAFKKGIKKDDILEIVESGNTVEDAYLSKPILDRYKPEKVFVSTSNFHLPRAKYIFEKILPQYKLKFLGSKESTSPLVLKKLKLHEKVALVAMKISGIRLPDGKVIPGR